MARPTKEQKAEAKLQYDLTPNTSWRTRIRDYTPLIGADNQQLLDHVRDVVYGMVLRGADEKDVIEYFGWDKNSVREQLRPVIEMAKAELRLILKQDQIETALGSKLPIMKIWSGKQMAGQVEGAPADTGGSGTATVTLRVVTNDNPEILQLQSELDALAANAERTVQ